MIGIYKIENKINGKIYIGQSNNLERRKTEHFNGSTKQEIDRAIVEEGRLCWLRSPLYIVKNGKNESYYFTDEEFNKVKVKGEVTRAKGLGELPADTARASMFTSEFQRMDVMEWNESAMDLLYDLMREEVEPRKNFIMSKVDFSEVRE